MVVGLGLESWSFRFSGLGAGKWNAGAGRGERIHAAVVPVVCTRSTPTGRIEKSATSTVRVCPRTLVNTTVPPVSTYSPMAASGRFVVSDGVTGTMSRAGPDRLDTWLEKGFVMVQISLFYSISGTLGKTD